MIRTTPFHERTGALNESGPVEPLVRLPGRGEVQPLREVRVLRRPQRRGPVRHVAAVQVPVHRPRRRGVPRRRAGPRPATCSSPATRSTRSGATTAASSSRTACSCGTRNDDFMLTAAEPNFAYFADLIGRATTSGSRRSRSSGRCSRSRGRGPAGCSPAWTAHRPPRLLRAHEGQDRRTQGHRLADGLHRRPRLRGLVAGRRRARGLGRRVGGVPRQRRPAVRERRCT